MTKKQRKPRPISGIKTIRTLEARVYNEQYDWIRKKFGKRAAEVANYGWGVTGDEDYVSVATKVYGHGVLESNVRLGADEIDHSFSER